MVPEAVAIPLLIRHIIDLVIVFVLLNPVASPERVDDVLGL
jgi:hypothetical protein